jgi:hypothetical protein
VKWDFEKIIEGFSPQLRLCACGLWAIFLDSVARVGDELPDKPQVSNMRRLNNDMAVHEAWSKLSTFKCHDLKTSESGPASLSLD